LIKLTSLRRLNTSRTNIQPNVLIHSHARAQCPWRTSPFELSALILSRDDACGPPLRTPVALPPRTFQKPKPIPKPPVQGCQPPTSQPCTRESPSLFPRSLPVALRQGTGSARRRTARESKTLPFLITTTVHPYCPNCHCLFVHYTSRPRP
jgi:hypothetical protein